MGGDWKDMFQGVKNNDLDLVKYYLKIGVDLNYQHPEYFTSVLVESIRMNNLEMMILLLQNGALPDVKEVYSNKVPITIAIENKNYQAVAILNEYMEI
nr:ankyrin repeat domain-containing protein [uncultured Flavobacterium sp.]